MCFSAGASFAASAVLGTIGAATISKAKDRSELPLAVVPLIFAIQQFIEGLLWLSFVDEPDFIFPLTYLFLFFAFFWWPIYAPLIAFVAEKNAVKKKIIAGLACIGALVGTYLYASFLLDPAPATIINRCIAYPINGPLITFFTYMYVLVTVGSGLISSRPIIKVFCLLLGTTALIAWIAYAQTFTSVWCFFAALISSVLYFYHKDERVKKAVLVTYRKQRKKLTALTQNSFN